MYAQHYLKRIPRLSLISRISKRKRIGVWLVGGFLRDIYLKPKVYPLNASKKSQPPHSLQNKGADISPARSALPEYSQRIDFDLCVEKKCLSLVREFAKRTSSKYICLDKSEGSWRVILKKKKRIYTYDFTLLRGRNLYDDLSLRDFSLNTLAVDINKKPWGLIDYFGARKDIKRRLIRTVNEKVFRHDPLRILRGFAFAANYGFRIEARTQKAMVKFKKLLKNVSWERINEELFKIFSSPYSFGTVKKLDKLKIIDEIIPYLNKLREVYQGRYHHLDVWQHSLETLRKFEAVYRRKLIKNKDIFNYLNEELARERKRLHILKLSCLLHDLGKPLAKKKRHKKTIFHGHEKIGRDLAESIACRLRLSLKERECLGSLIYWHLRPGYLADTAPPSRRAVYRFWRDTKNEGVAIVLLSLSDWRATRGPLVDEIKRRSHERVMFRLIDNYFKEKKKIPFPKIVDGYDIMSKFNLPPGPLIGKILRKIQEEQALGKISTPQEAYKAAKQLIQ